MEYEEDDDAFERESPQPVDEDVEDEVPVKRPGKKEASDDDEELVNEKRGYTNEERNMIEEWLRNHKPKSDGADEETA